LYAVRQVPLLKAKDDSVRYFIPLGPIAPGSSMLNYAIKVLPPRQDLKLKDEIARKERQLQLLQATTLMDTIAILSGKNPHIVEGFAAEMELYKRPLNQRIDVAYIKRELEKELSSRDITSPFNLEIRDKNSTLYAFANFSH